MTEPTDAELKTITARVAVHDLQGWFDELSRLLRLSDEIGIGWLREDARWHTMEINGRRHRYLAGASPVRFVGPNAVNLTLPCHLLPALVVSLSAPDSVILAEVGRVLAEARQHHPQPIDRPGMAAQGKSIDWPRLFESWRNHQIVELAELLAWRHRLPEREQPAKVKLGTRLGFKSDRNRVGRAEDKLKAGIARLPDLAAALRHDKTLVAPATMSELGEEGRAMLAAMLADLPAEG